MIRRTVSLFRTGAGQRAGEIDPAPAERGGKPKRPPRTGKQMKEDFFLRGTIDKNQAFKGLVFLFERLVFMFKNLQRICGNAHTYSVKFVTSSVTSISFRPNFS